MIKTIVLKKLQILCHIKERREAFLLNIFADYQKDKFPTLYALIYSLITKYDKIPDFIDLKTADYLEMGLVEEVLKRSDITEEQFDIIQERFFEIHDSVPMDA